jgi:hypothetical protein
VTISLSVAALLETGFLSTHLARTTVLFFVSYLALRRSTPEERIEILHALGPVLCAIESEPRTPTLSMSFLAETTTLGPRRTTWGSNPGPKDSRTVIVVVRG